MANNLTYMGYSMSKPKKHKGETIFNYVPDYLPSFNVDNPVYVKLPPDTKDSRLKDVERELIEYWDLLHPIVREYMIMIVKYVNKFGEGTDDLEHLRRSLDIELSNSSELSDENRKFKAQIADLLVEKKALNEKVSDIMSNRPIVSAEELQSLKMLISSKYDVSSGSLDELMAKAVQEARESEEIKRAKDERDKMRKELEEAKEHFEKTQAEVGETFQKKLLESQVRIEELEEELTSSKSN
ncbi:MAG: hypothetical protein H7647_03995 [Candidatus Heimdallarchaeota archaeon]|nr:hypothetical protein [Candidatus Heimdallarchaeota archaeon]MCK4253590.1 hypothetical protein [Candidatus Heimdallarchaeota archaeon]